jgi:predicted kinase
VIVHCVAPIEVLEARIEQRDKARTDASEATLEVLASQRQRYEPPLESEGTVVTVDTAGPVDAVAIGNRVRAAARFRPPTS